jgi:hypothetical protein
MNLTNGPLVVSSSPKNKEERTMTKESLKQWYETVAQHMPHLSKPQAFVLALWSLGMVIARSCFLAKPVGVKENALRERLRDFYREASAKKGKRELLC